MLRRALAELPAYVPGARSPVGAAAFKLSSNENPFPPLPSVMAAIADAAVDVNRYPDMYATELTEAVEAIDEHPLTADGRDVVDEDLEADV